MKINTGDGTMGATHNSAAEALMQIEFTIKKSELTIDRLIGAIKLAECQYLGCGGNLTDAEIVRQMRIILNEALQKCGASYDPPPESIRPFGHNTLIGRLRSLCEDCEKHDDNVRRPMGQQMQPICSWCKMDWEAAAEIEFLRGRLERLLCERRT